MNWFGHVCVERIYDCFSVLSSSRCGQRRNQTLSRRVDDTESVYVGDLRFRFFVIHVSTVSLSTALVAAVYANLRVMSFE